MEKEIKEAYKEIEKLTNIARESINKAREIAEKYGLVFSVDFGYGICGVFDETSRKNQNERKHSECITKIDPEWEPSNEYDEGWESSSQIEDDWLPY
jgi:hypothetical protein